MFRIFFFSVVVAGCGSFKKETGPAYTFSGVVTQTSSYCGGARPSEEILEEHNRPKAYAGKVLHVRKGDDNNAQGKVMLKLITNDSGYFSGSLPPGKYCIVQEEQLKPLDFSQLQGNKERPVKLDTTCLQKWWKGTLAEMDLNGKNVNGLKINFHHPCFVSGDIPCLRYTGPMPQ